MRTFSIFTRVLAAFLIFLLGFLVFPAALVGAGYWAYNNLSFEFLEETGAFDVDEESVLSKDAEVSLTSATIKELIEEAKYIASIKDEVSVDTLVARYGLILPDEVNDVLTAEMKAKPFGKLFSEEGVDDLLSNIYIGDLLKYDSEPNPAYDPETAPDESELLWYSGETLLGKVDSTLASIKLSELVSGDFSVDNIIDELKLADIFKLTAKEGVPAYITSEDGNTLAEGLSITVWLDDAGAPADAIIGAIAGYGIDDIESKLDELYIADVIGVVSFEGEWYSWDYENGENGERILLTPESGLTAELGDLTINSISNGGLNDKLDTIKVSTLFEYTYDEETDTWYDGDTPVEGVMATLADYTVGELDTEIGNIKVGEFADYIYVASENPEEEGIWYEVYEGEGSENNIIATGVLAELADLTIDQMTNDDELSAEIKTLTVADALGYELRDDGKWYKDEEASEPIDGVMAAIAEFTLGSLDSEINNVKIGEVANYYYNTEDSTWYEDELFTVPASGILGSFADLTIDQMTDEASLSAKVKTLTVADALGYELREDGKWYKDSDTTEPLDGVMAVIADSVLENLDTDIDNVYLGEVANYYYNTEDSTWYEDEFFTVPAGGILGTLAGLTIEQMTDEAALSAKVKTLTVADALGYELVGNDYYDGSAKVTGVMAVIAGSKLNNIQSTINGNVMGDILGYTKDEDTKTPVYGTDGVTVVGYNYVWYDGEISEDNTLHPLMNKVSNTKFEDLGGITDTMVLGDVIDSDHRTGFLTFLDPNTKFNEINKEMNNIFNEHTMREFVEAGAIEFSSDDKKAKFLDSYFATLKMPELIDWLLTINDNAYVEVDKNTGEIKPKTSSGQ